jgi:uncharacterized protein (TIGR02996 family)
MHAKSFLAAIAAEPDSDLPRLVYADWLEENGKAERAELIRLSCRLDPDRERYDDLAINALRSEVEGLLEADRRAEHRWLYKLSPGQLLCDRVRVRWRRGLVDSLELPVRWFVEHGARFRKRYPLLRKLVLFRLNGWGERLAACKWLKGIRELELACWYADADAVALAASPHLGNVERLTLWAGGGLEQARQFARATAWPGLRELHLVSREGPAGEWDGPTEEWARAVNDAAGRSLATVYDFRLELLRFPFAPDFDEDEGFLVGRLPGGEQLFAWAPEYNPSATGWLFNPDGTRRQPFLFPFPPEPVLPFESPPGCDPEADRALREQVRASRRALLAESTGFVPAFIRVEEFTIDIDDLFSINPSYDQEHDPVSYHWGDTDDPAEVPEEAQRDGLPWWGGAGESVYRRVQAAKFELHYGDLILECNRTGRV